MIMGVFDKLFGKKNNPIQEKKSDIKTTKEGDVFVSVGDNRGYKIIRQLSDIQKEKIDKSTIQLMASQLYMHYWTDNLICDNPNDQEWQNKVMFFWKAEEPFPKKSLPPHFENFKVKHFVFKGNSSDVSILVGEAMPWFGMPGQGEKHVCERNGQKISIPELYELNVVQYVEFVELGETNLEILTDRENYLFLIDNRITPFRNGNFYLNDKPIPIDVAYSIGGIHIVKRVSLE